MRKNFVKRDGRSELFFNVNGTESNGSGHSSKRLVKSSKKDHNNNKRPPGYLVQACQSSVRRTKMDAACVGCSANYHSICNKKSFDHFEPLTPTFVGTCSGSAQILSQRKFTCSFDDGEATLACNHVLDFK